MYGMERETYADYNEHGKECDSADCNDEDTHVQRQAMPVLNAEETRVHRVAALLNCVDPNHEEEAPKDTTRDSPDTTLARANHGG